MTKGDKISADEIALYDRQIRLWGLAAQTRMRGSNILIINIGALANEVAKNIVLAGIGSLTVLDNKIVEDIDLGAQFFIEQADIGSNRAEAALPRIQNLNSRVSVIADPSDFREKSNEFFAQFDVIVGTELGLNDLVWVNEKARKNNKPFYAGSVIGFYGFIFADLIKHQFSIQRDKGNISTKIGPETNTRTVIDVVIKKEDQVVKEIVTKQEVYKPLSESIKSNNLSKLRPRQQLRVSPVLPALLAAWQFEITSGKKPTEVESAELFNLALQSTRSLGLPVGIINQSFVSSFVRNFATELSPVAAILGGVLGQDILNFLGQREQPIQNWVVFDGDGSLAPIYAL
ncbi:hypothetical protein V1514DRAFT_324129 [Lipomyces japonicus]|uniref:uncharacterized protein n=1 Tax=Lipomyces japonicus TaxID=56871 RepID=UPI0034CD42ED